MFSIFEFQQVLLISRAKAEYFSENFDEYILKFRSSILINYNL